MISLPDTPNFRNFLSLLTVNTFEGELEICHEKQGIMANGRIVKYPALYLSPIQTEYCKLSVLTRKLAELWEGSQHPSSPRIAELTVAVFSILKAGYPDSLSLFNDLLKSLVPVDVSHYSIFPNKAQPGMPAQFVDFRAGKVQSLSLQYRSKRANSDYYELNKDSLRDKHCLESPIYKRTVMSFLDLFWNAPSRRNIASDLFNQTLLNYYEEISLFYTEMMWQDLDDHQSIGTAAGFEVFNVPSLKQFPGTNYVTIYLNQTAQQWDGYVVPSIGVMRFNSWSENQEIILANQAFQTGISAPVSPTLTQVARYGVIARRAAGHDKLSDALLNFTIALEMLFSEKTMISQAISRRLAVIISEPNPNSYKSNKKHILALYDARSQYVHSGNQPSKDTVDAMTVVFDSVLRVLVRLERRQSLHMEEKFTKWIHLLDWIAAGYEADQIPSNSIQVEIGLIEQN